MGYCVGGLFHLFKTKLSRQPPAAAATAATITPWLSRGSRGALTLHPASSRTLRPAGLLQRSGFVYESSQGGRGRRADTQGTRSLDPGRQGVGAEAGGSGYSEADRCGAARGRPWRGARETWTSQRLRGPRRPCYLGVGFPGRGVSWGKGRRQDCFWTVPGARAPMFEKVL